MVAPDEPLHSYWLNRFEVFAASPGRLRLRDWLRPAPRELAVAAFEGLEGRARDQAFFRHGFIPAAMTSTEPPIGDRPEGRAQGMFWQFPCRTEGAAWEAHAGSALPHFDGEALHTYLGLPWATWIDMDRKKAWADAGREELERLLWRVGVELAGMRHGLAEVGLQHRVHTVCQHIYWADLRDTWRRLGITDLWLSHCPAGDASKDHGGFRLHAWPLYAVNVEAPERRAGLHIGKPARDRTVLASFVGAHMPHYLSDVRLRLKSLADTPGFVIEVTDEWHFEGLVYRQQIAREQTAGHGNTDEAVARYNRLLSDSRFALCPAGAGANTLRLWEALAVGAVPVLLGPPPRLPDEGAARDIDWDRIVVRASDAALRDLPGRLRAMPLDEVAQRQRLGVEAYARMKELRCF